jgi:hypothetical protein
MESSVLPDVEQGKLRRFAVPFSSRLGADLMERIKSTHSIWLFDVERMRFRRVPKGTDANAPSLDSDWEPYFALDVDNETGAFTVALNEDRTRLLRAWRDDVPDTQGTGELKLQPSAET